MLPWQRVDEARAGAATSRPGKTTIRASELRTGREPSKQAAIPYDRVDPRFRPGLHDLTATGTPGGRSITRFLGSFCVMRVLPAASGANTGYLNVDEPSVGGNQRGC
jgi:hypothetical protein